MALVKRDAWTQSTTKAAHRTTGVVFKNPIEGVPIDVEPDPDLVAGSWSFATGTLPPGWVVTQGTYHHTDNYYRDCLYNNDPSTLLIVTGPVVLDPGSDWTILLTAGGKLPEQCGTGLQVVSDGGPDITGFGWYGLIGSPPLFMGGGGSASSYVTSGDPNWYTWKISHDSTSTDLYVAGDWVESATWPGVGSGATGGALVITVPWKASIRSLTVYDHVV